MLIPLLALAIGLALLIWSSGRFVDGAVGATAVVPGVGTVDSTKYNPCACSERFCANVFIQIQITSAKRSFSYYSSLRFWPSWLKNKVF